MKNFYILLFLVFSFGAKVQAQSMIGIQNIYIDDNFFGDSIVVTDNHGNTFSYTRFVKGYKAKIKAMVERGYGAEHFVYYLSPNKSRELLCRADIKEHTLTIDNLVFHEDVVNVYFKEKWAKPVSVNLYKNPLWRDAKKGDRVIHQSYQEYESYELRHL